NSPSPCTHYLFEPWDSLAHRCSLVPSSCTPRTRAYPRHSSSTLPGTCPLTGATGTPLHTTSAPLWSPTPHALPMLCICGHGDHHI
ncbi:hypothetical protein C0993_008157, partial [Termitomyces sp. T159_Od127]